jgi:hypothetical protein
MIILNGRTPGDLYGNFTYHEAGMSSALDLSIVSLNLLKDVVYFKVLDPVWFSDHCPISTEIKVQIQNSLQMTTAMHGKAFFKYIWNAESEDKFKSGLRKVTHQAKLSSFCVTQFSNSTEAADALCEILNSVARDSIKKIKVTTKNRMKQRDEYSIEIQHAKRNFKQAKRAFQNNDRDPEKRFIFVAARKKYKQTINRVKKFTKEKQLHKLSQLEKSDPRSFWQAVKRLITPNDKGPQNIENEHWVEHFTIVHQVTEC